MPQRVQEDRLGIFQWNFLRIVADIVLVTVQQTVSAGKTYFNPSDSGDHKGMLRNVRPNFADADGRL